jgi:NAD(P)-dependent dehydrogenase (short-subunit alcohol dehydrogenase family)
MHPRAACRYPAACATMRRAADARTSDERPRGMAQLDGQIALVTGAGRGLGYAVARTLAAHGARVLAVARNAHELAQLRDAIRGDGGEVETIQVDLSNLLALDALGRDAVERHGRVDTLVNNAAVLHGKSFEELTAEEFEASLATNLLAPTRLTRALLPAMRADRRGSIINVTSASGRQPFLNETDYCAAKFGLEGFTQALALELADSGVTANLISPGMTIKPTSVTTAEFAAWPAARRALYRDPAEMADAFVWLAQQRHVNGRRFNGFELAAEVREHGWDWRPTADEWRR